MNGGASGDERLAGFLRDRGLLHGDVVLDRIGDGHSNVTHLASDGTRRVIVRRPPSADGPYDVLREAGVIRAVGAVDFPVPRVLATAEAGAVLDVPFFVMSYEPGAIVTTDADAVPVDARREVSLDVARTLARLHDLDWTTLGLRGRPEGANARQRARTARLVADADGRPPSAFAEVDAWLEAHTPVESGASLLHNDLRLGNVVLDVPARRVRSVLDWELAGVGDPLVDLGYLVATWAEPGRPTTPVEELGRATAAPGFASRSDLVDAYADARGIDPVGLDWYVALAYWKLAVLFEFNRRLADAGTGDPYYAGPSKVAALLSAAAAAAR